MGTAATEEKEDLVVFPRSEVRKEYENYLLSLDELLTAEARDPSTDPRTLKILKEFLSDECDWLLRHPEATPEHIVAEFQDRWIFHNLHGPHGPQGSGTNRIVKIVVSDKGD